jgi:hypothetical protein
MVKKTYKYQGTPSSPWWYGGEYWSEEHGDEEANATGHANQASLASFRNAGSGFND